MMGVYIKGMEMPRHCGECGIEWCDRWKRLVVAGMAIAKERPSDCPLVPVPPHGRLGDLDALMGEFERAQRTMQQHGREYSCSFLSSSQELSTEWYCVEDILENAPTIIPAEEGET